MDESLETLFDDDVAQRLELVVRGLRALEEGVGGGDGQCAARHDYTIVHEHRDNRQGGEAQ